MTSPACEKNGEKKIIRVIDRDTAAEFIADFLLDPTIKLRPDQYQEGIGPMVSGMESL